MSAALERACFGRRYTISASHRLHTDALSAAENRAVYGKCNNPQGHGHNYVVEVLVGGEVDAETGMVVNMAALDEAVRSRVLERFDHANLNLDPIFANLVPTTENFCLTAFNLLKEKFAPGGRFLEARLHRVRVEETSSNFFECEDPGSGEIEEGKVS